jgi:hypothetical protein
MAIAKDEAVPDDIKKASIPVLCREAFEATAWDVYSWRALARGEARADIEKVWDETTTTKRRITLAIDPKDDTAIEKWQAGEWYRKAAMMVVTKGIHTGLTDYEEAVKAARSTVRDLAKLAS